MIVESITAMAAGMAIAFIFGWKLALMILGMAPIMVLSGSRESEREAQTDRQINEQLKRKREGKEERNGGRDSKKEWE